MHPIFYVSFSPTDHMFRPWVSGIRGDSQNTEGHGQGLPVIPTDTRPRGTAGPPAGDHRGLMAGKSAACNLGFSLHDRWAV
jgi:hypothetical protein